MTERDDREVVLGLDFGGTKIAAALSSRDGSRLADGTADTDSSAGADLNLARSVELGRDLLRQLDRTGSPRLCAVGACTFGLPHEDGVELSPAVPGWDRLPLRRRLEEAFEVPVVVMNDAKAAALAEARGGALQGASPGLYLNIGTGLSSAVVDGGAVMTGAHGAAGEIGYNLRRIEDARRGADETAGILEDVVSGRGLATSACAADPSAPADAGTVFARVEEEPFRELVESFIGELAYHLVNLVIAVDPETVAIGGGLVRSWDRLEGPLRQAIDAHVPFPPKLVLGAFPYDAAVRGAVELGLQLAYENAT